MTDTGARPTGKVRIIPFLLVAVASFLLGYWIGTSRAREVLSVAKCADQLIVINPNGPSNQLTDRYVCMGPAHVVTWRSSNAAPINVEWVSISPSTAPYPYTLNCSNYTSASCFSGPLSPNAAVGSTATYKVTFQGGQSFNGRIIINP